MGLPAKSFMVVMGSIFAQLYDYTTPWLVALVLTHYSVRPDKFNVCAYCRMCVDVIL